MIGNWIKVTNIVPNGWISYFWYKAWGSWYIRICDCWSVLPLYLFWIFWSSGWISCIFWFDICDFAVNANKTTFKITVVTIIPIPASVAALTLLIKVAKGHTIKASNQPEDQACLNVVGFLYSFSNFASFIFSMLTSDLFTLNSSFEIIWSTFVFPSFPRGLEQAVQVNNTKKHTNRIFAFLRKKLLIIFPLLYSLKNPFSIIL